MYKEVSLQLKKSKSIVILTGAGVSTASGIPDFRSSNGIWKEDESREYYMSHHYFHKDPENFWEKYKNIFRLKLLENYQPNSVHYFIKDLETDKCKVTVVTQNVDGLHTSAGSRNVIEYHGSLKGAKCPTCEKEYDSDYIMASSAPLCRNCNAYLKPGVVLFGDMITSHEVAEKAIEESDTLLVMGTSLLVTPFSLLPYHAYESGKTSILMNNEPTVSDHLFDFVIHEDLTQAIQKLTPYIRSMN